jgi:hypothetical protein
MIQNTIKNNDAEKFIEQDVLDPPDSYFYIDEELAAQLKRFEGQSFTISGAVDIDTIKKYFNYVVGNV